VRELRARERTLDDMSDFVEKSRVRRDAIRAEKELAAAPGGGGGAPAPLARAAGALAAYAPPLLLAALWWAFSGAPLVALPRGAFSPVQFLVARGGGEVGAAAWLAAAHTVAAAAVPAALDATGLVPAKPQATLVQRALDWSGLGAFLK